MFTGIVAEKGTITALERGATSARLTVRCRRVLADVRRGDSIAVSGVCLTVTEFDDEHFTADVMAVTLGTTTLGRAEVGDEVNLEPAVAAGERLGGHIVQGHVDGTAPVLAVEPGESWRIIRFGLDAALAPLVARKGSVALNGVSLTVSEVGRTAGRDWFEVSLIPETLLVTNLCTIEEGGSVNIETDILARHVQRLLARTSRSDADTPQAENEGAAPAAQTGDAR